MKGLAVGGDVVITPEGNCGYCGEPATDLKRLGTQWIDTSAWQDVSNTRYQVLPCHHVYTALHPREISVTSLEEVL